MALRKKNLATDEAMLTLITLITLDKKTNWSVDTCARALVLDQCDQCESVVNAVFAQSRWKQKSRHSEAAAQRWQLGFLPAFTKGQRPKAKV